MGLLSKDAILKVDDRQIEEVEVSEWGGSVLVVGLDGAGRDAYFASMATMRQTRGGRTQMGVDAENATAKLVARCILDPDDEQRQRLMFTQQEVHALGEKSGAALNRVYDVAMRLSGLSDEDMEELGKASEATQSDGSTSPSPKTSAARSKSS
jgi:ABC-type cobalamin transport system ATPase subunit